MPKRGKRSSAGNREYIYAPSSSSGEDWGDESWEVDGIIGEHVNSRGERQYKASDEIPTCAQVRLHVDLSPAQVAWGGWSRSDGTNWTWEKENGTTMKDLSGMLKKWRKEKLKESMQQAQTPLVAPFRPYALPVDDDTDNGDVKTGPKDKKKVAVRYGFTELTDQARKLAVDLKDDSAFAPSTSLPFALERLQAMREKRDAALKAFDVTTIQDAVSQCLYELGPAPQKEGRYQAQKRLSLHRRMETLNLSRHVPKRPGHGPSRHPLPITCSEPSTSQATPSYNFIFYKPNESPRSSDRPSRPLPKRRTPVSDSSSLTRIQPSISTPTLVSSARSTASDSTLGLPFTSSNRRLSISSNDTLCPPSTIHQSSFPQGSSQSITNPPPANTSITIRNQPAALRPRDILQAKWAAAVAAAGAAPITIVNDFNDDEIPAVNPTMFRYVEFDYIYGRGVTRSDDGFIESCECSDSCTASLCSCQDDSDIQDDDGISKTLAYDANGLFTFNDSIMSYVIECNQNCHCDERCPSRVAQRPRTFPVEIFRTERYGWGVRSTVALPRGRVLGVYTGELLQVEFCTLTTVGGTDLYDSPRKVAKTFTVQRASYLFDLDFMVSGTGGYSVDAYQSGNWTRFVNHSCDPVCALYSVIWDSVPAMHQPKIAFVASKDIPARTELTIDYCPQARKGKGKAKRKLPDTPDCTCGTEDCRGFIYLAH